MDPLKTAIKVTLTFFALTVLLGGVWFLGDEGTYLALVFGAATGFWIVAWERTSLQWATGLSATTSLLTSSLIFWQSFDKSELDVNILKLAIALISLAGCYVWSRRLLFGSHL